MDKIATAEELQTELRAIWAMTEEPDPSRAKIAAALNNLVERLSANKPRSVPDRHQLKVLIDTVKNPLKGKFLGGPSAEEAEEILRNKFNYTDREIQKLKTAGEVFGST